MASISFFFLFLSLSSFTALSLKKQSNITIGSSLTPNKNSSWLSPSGLYAFGFYKKANGYAIGIFLAGIPQKTVVWTANRDDPPISSEVTLVFSSSIGLLLRGASNSVVISASQTASLASMSDSGNFMIYNSDNEVIWQSFDHPTDTLLQTQRLEAGSTLFSSVSENDHSTGIFRLAMQNDGNLVQYPIGFGNPEDAYYATRTDGSGDNVTLNLRPDGLLYLLNSTGFNIMNLTSGGFSMRYIYLMRIDIDGIFRLYSNNLSNNGNWSVLWASGYDKCNPKGLCGFNSYCILNDQEPDCECLPGFGFVIEGNWSAGCQRNFVANSCKNDDSDEMTSDIRIHELANTRWDDDPYSVISISIKEDCEKACLEDCNCDAAFFKDSQCRKQRLPLRYGRRDQSESNSALIKVGTSLTITSPTNRSVDDPIEKKGGNKIGKSMLIVSISIIAFGLVILAISGVAMHKYHSRAYERISNNQHIGLSEEITLRPFTYLEIEKMTDDFKEEIGRGSFGIVYKGVVTSTGLEKLVAVKKLDGMLDQGEREFQTEVKVIGKTHHKNLVRLLGYCNEGSNRLLVYEYMSNKSLAHVLFSSFENRPCFAERVDIARKIAKGILYLHEECEAQIIHCDIKPENILMDEYNNPKISDFGLAKLLKPGQANTNTVIRGTRGYVAPEWHRKLPVTVKADVYSFGIMLLEIASCRRNVDHSLQENECVLVDWVYNCFEAGEIQKLVSGDEEVDMKQMDRMIKIGLWCTLDEPSLRPSMKKVLLMLEGTVDIPIPPSPTSFISCI
ncbi:hypothetical protein JCGZ_22227 [Jatropha curcas]|uniref:Receptor-like serine/threonine-protein kinase n=1 Tax=Jatropha curcas TaxID=180498 RepID=A0A067JQ92_JATCU|nr:hypothetical protein JCGZ_22227 [Jatropha curcas]